MLACRFSLVVMSFCLAVSALCPAEEINVATTSQLSSALAAAQPGDTILIAPGTYGGGHFRAGLTNVSIRGSDPADPPVISGGNAGFQLSDATDVTLEHLIFEQQTGNGLNIDDGGSFSTPSTGVTLRNLIVRDMNAGGNNDGIKLSGVTGFLIENVLVENWGNGGSAVDPVGSHDGLIQNSLFRHTSGGSSGIRPKGGSKNITIRANRFEMADSGRAIQAGGSTGAQFFRFIDGDSGYEAAEIVAEGNVVIGASSAFSYVNIDGGLFHHNYVQRPQTWAVRILNENAGNSIVDTQNGRFLNNLVVYNDTPSEWSRAVNVGGETLPETFEFVGNSWYNLADPTPGGSTPNLPVAETDGSYGVEPTFTVDDAIAWDFAWGKWIVNASEQATSFDTAGISGLQLATPADGARFDPLEAQPLDGDWTLAALPATVQLPPFSQKILIDPSFYQAAVPGDYDGSGTVDAADYALWREQFGQLGSLSADGNRDGRVDAADYAVWRDNLDVAATVQSTTAVAEPSTLAIAGALVGLVRALALR